MRSLAVLPLVCLIAACAPSASGTPTPPSLTTGGPCLVTTAPPVAITPPPSAGSGPNPSLVFRSSPSSFLYGNDALVVDLPNDGLLVPSDPARGLAGGMKFAWWRVGRGELTIATRRLDAAAVPLLADVPSGYGDSGFQVSGLRFPSAGCWQVTGTVGGKSLTFVVNVPDR